MSLYNGPPRGGTRGGKDQFSWENVKADKDREYYLGHSVKALTGRWQKGKDVYWYTREKGDDGSAAALEMHAVKQREEELMAEALGIKPKVIRAPKQPQLDQRDMAQLMSKEEDEAEEEGVDREGDRIKGLGYSVTAVRGAGDAEHEVLPGTVPAKQLPGPPPTGAGQLPPPPVLTEADAKRMRKAQKKAAKEARRAEKKEKRKAKKALKKEKKLAKKAKVEEQAAPAAKSGEGASSPSSSSSDGADSDDAEAPAGVKRAGRHDTPSPEPVQARQRERSPMIDQRRDQGARKHRHDSHSPELAGSRRRERSPMVRDDAPREQATRRGGHESRSPDRRERHRGRRHHSRSPDERERYRSDLREERTGIKGRDGDERRGRDRDERRRGSPERSDRHGRRRSRSHERRGRDRS